MNFSAIPQTLTKHRNEQDAFLSRVKTIRNLIEVSKRKAEWHVFTSRLLGGMNPARAKLDFQVSSRLYDWITSHVAYRRDVVDVETIKIPEVTLKIGGDCDDLVVLSGTMLESVGVPVKISVSQQMGDGSYDHIFLYLPSLMAIFDCTAEPKRFPGDPIYYNRMKVLE